MIKNKKGEVEQVITKARNWSFVAYPESLPSDWIDRLQMTGLPFCLSPLHDKDTNPDGTPKKEHYHVIVCFNGPTTFSHVKKYITDPLGQPHPQFLMSIKGMYRYLTHQDNPEKYQYNPQNIKNFNGFSIQDVADLTITEEDRLFDSLENIIFDQKIKDYFFLIKFLKENGLFEQLSFVRRHTYHIEKLISSLRHSGYFDLTVDQETGEVFENKD